MASDLNSLIEQALTLQEEHKTNDDLAKELRAMANAVYGVNDRSPEFIAALTLAGQISEQVKKNWDTKFITDFTARCLELEEGGDFYPLSVAIGHVDLLLDEKPVHRIIGICAGLNGKVYSENVFFADLNSSRGMRRRGMKLYEHLRPALPNPGDRQYGFTMPVISPRDICYAVRLSEESNLSVWPALREDSLNIDIVNPYEVMPTHQTEILSKLIGQASFNPKQVGRVNDGGSRYRR